MADTEITTIDIEMEPRLVRGKAQAFWLGELDENDREVWIWLPLSQITVDESTPPNSKLATVTIGEWLAIEKGIENC